MKNKVYLKRLFIILIIFIILITLINSLIYYKEYILLNKNFNYKINNIISKYNLDTNEVLDIINTKDDNLSNYNIDINKDILIKENNTLLKKIIILNNLLIIIGIFIVIYLFLRYHLKRNKEINNITKLIEEINKKNYQLDIDDFNEDELSILKNEIYKTTIMLKMSAENSLKDKKELKRFLEDISHQIKTPLTSISIMLDNLLLTNIDKKTEQEFLLEIKKEINNINYLIQYLLKLSKLDTNTLKLKKDKIYLKELVNSSIHKVSCLSDLKNIKINIHEENKCFIYADYLWQIEAISNILKNSIEYSKEFNSIDITIKDNTSYSSIIIKDYGCGISNYDLKHIFDRFYKVNNNNDGIGIGLSLSYNIIKKQNGTIEANSTLNKGTTFIIKYFKI